MRGLTRVLPASLVVSDADWCLGFHHIRVAASRWNLETPGSVALRKSTRWPTWCWSQFPLKYAHTLPTHTPHCKRVQRSARYAMGGVLYGTECNTAMECIPPCLATCMTCATLFLFLSTSLFSYTCPCLLHLPCPLTPPCFVILQGSCKDGDTCPYAHGVFEVWLHPSRFRTELCKDGTSCTRKVSCTQGKHHGLGNIDCPALF